MRGWTAWRPRAQAAFAGVNGLDMTAFPSVVTLENDVVGAAARLLGGGPGTAGTFTSGGTESCLLAVLTARGTPRDPRRHRARGGAAADRARRLPQGGRTLRAHPSPSPSTRTTFRARPRDVAAALGPHTALVVASAPSYAHGVVDPVPEIAAAAAGQGVLCHVDACIGGWYLGCRWLARGVDPPPPFDL